MAKAPFQGEVQTTDAHVSHAPSGHETSDVSLRPLIVVAIVLVAASVFTFVAMWVAIRSFERTERRDERPPSPVAEARPLPPEPRLQPTISHHDTLPHEDVLSMQRANQDALKNYGWVDQQRGIVRIPIEVAMQRMVQQAHGRPGQNPPTTQGAAR